MDNDKWNDYNFDYLFRWADAAGVAEGTRKLFYVCCTRSKEKLALYCHTRSAAALAQARAWFGDENVIQF